jgi:hypothetical protein
VQNQSRGSQRGSGLRISPLSNPLLFFAALFSLGIHALAMHWPPLQHVLGTQPLDGGVQMWLTLAALSLTVFVAMEVFKLVRAMTVRGSAR